MKEQEFKMRMLQVVDCDCGHTAPIDYVVKSEDGIYTCTNCVIEELSTAHKNLKLGLIKALHIINE